MAGKVKAITDAAKRSKRWVEGFKLDSWQNLLTGLGTLWDKSRWTIPRATSFLDPETLEALFINDPWARRIVEAPVKAAMRQGFEFVSHGMWVQTSARSGAWTWYEPDPEQAKREAIVLEQEFKRLEAFEDFTRLFIFGRLWGREAILIGADDGQELSEPLKEEAIKEIRYLEIIDRRNFWPASYQREPAEARYGEPETWTIHRVSGHGGTAEVVHHSRLIMAGGVMISRQKKMENHWSDASVLQAVITELQRFNTDNMAVSSMMMDSSQAILKIAGFADILAGNDKDTLRTRMDIIDRGRSVSRIMPIDAGDGNWPGEEFQYVERSFAGISDIMSRRQQLLAGSIGWPVTIMFGREPAGLSATGEADIRAWYDTVHSDRIEKYQPLIEILLRIVADASEVEEPDSWSISWPSLWQETPKEKAERQKLVAETDNSYINTGVLDPEEVATARFGEGEWSDKAPQLDMVGREALRQQDLQRAKGEVELGEEELYGAPAAPSEPAVIAPEVSAVAEPEVQKSALNGAQMGSLTEKILIPAAMGQIPRESAIESLMLSFPTVERERAERILGSIGKGFVPSGVVPAQPVIDALDAALIADASARTDPDITAKPPKEWSGKMKAQSVTLPGEWDKAKAQKWLKENDYRSTVERGGEDEKARWRARQFNPSHFTKEYSVKKLPNGVQLVLGRVK